MLENMNDKPITLVDAKTWKGLGDDARATTGMVKAHVSRPKAVKQSGEETERILSWIVSTEGRDRDGDRIMQAGWELENFRNNPVVMFAHDYGTLPIGRALETEVVEINGEAVLRMVKQFTPRDLNPMGFMVYEMARDDYLRTASVGFIIKKATPDPELAEEDRGLLGGYLMELQELLESSVAPIPSNPGALAEARSVGGIDTTPLIPWAEKILDAARSPASGLTREQVEDIHRATAPDRRFFDMGRNASTQTIKSALTWDDSHPDGTPVADREMEWDGPAQVAAADIEDLIVMATWVDDEDPDQKGSYKLPHHEAAGENATVWRGVTAAMGALLGARGGVDIPDADRQAVYDHLARHYRDDFDEDPPEFRAGHMDDDDEGSGHEDEDEDEDDKAPSRVEVKDGAVYLNGTKVQRCQRVTITPGPDGESVVTLELTPTEITIESKAKPVIGKGEPEPTPDNVINFAEISATDMGALVSDAFKPKADA